VRPADERPVRTAVDHVAATAAAECDPRSSSAEVVGAQTAVDLLARPERGHEVRPPRHAEHPRTGRRDDDRVVSPQRARVLRHEPGRGGTARAGGSDRSGTERREGNREDEQDARPDQHRATAAGAHTRVEMPHPIPPRVKGGMRPDARSATRRSRRCSVLLCATNERLARLSEVPATDEQQARAGTRSALSPVLLLWIMWSARRRSAWRRGSSVTDMSATNGGCPAARSRPACAYAGRGTVELVVDLIDRALRAPRRAACGVQPPVVSLGATRGLVRSEGLAR
jgi:hypothetical protein